MNSLPCRQVHPNPSRSSDLKLKLYEYAGKIVGKCLYESSLGRHCQQMVKARFTRSFLAQLIGLRINHRVSDTHARTHACIHTHAYTHARTHTHARTRTHTHTHARALLTDGEGSVHTLLPGSADRSTHQPPGQ